VRVATFNLLSGRSLTDGRADPDALVEAVRVIDADVLGLQEVDRSQPRSGMVDQAAVAAQASGAVAWRFLQLVAGTPGTRGWRPAGGSIGDGEPTYGLALASRRPVSSWRVLRLGRARGRYPIVVPTSPPRVIWIPDEPRAALAAVLEEPRLTVAVTHLSFVPGMNVVQLRRLGRALAQLPGPHVLLGDINLPGALAARITGWRPLVTGPTFPAPAPRLQLDHVLGHDLPHEAAKDPRILQLPLSDHRALTVDLTL
jgi:endonuclease/exonuclease/phosphatase family metal-dependent hydrolase